MEELASAWHRSGEAVVSCVGSWDGPSRSSNSSILPEANSSILLVASRSSTFRTRGGGQGAAIAGRGRANVRNERHAPLFCLVDGNSICC